MASIKKRPDGQWRARYRDAAGREHAKHFPRKVDAQKWLDEVTASVVTGAYVDPKARKITVAEWSDVWLAGYGNRRPASVRQARVHVAKIREEFGPLPLSAVRPSAVKSWLSALRQGDKPLSVSYVYALHSRLSQIMGDAVLDGVLPSNPCSRRTSPPAGAQRPYVATTAQVWALHDAMPDRYRLAVLLGAFAGLRLAESCGLRPGDVAFLHREIRPAVQYPAQPLKTPMSQTAIPVPSALVAHLSAQVAEWPGMTVLTDDKGAQVGPWKLERAFRTARKRVPDLPAGFRYQDLRHYFASLLIASGADVKVVQHRLRHASAKTTLDTYGHLWPDSDESTRTAVERVMLDRPADSVRTVEITP
jgi:integrase